MQMAVKINGSGIETETAEWVGISAGNGLGLDEATRSTDMRQDAWTGCVDEGMWPWEKKS